MLLRLLRTEYSCQLGTGPSCARSSASLAACGEVSSLSEPVDAGVEELQAVYAHASPVRASADINATFPAAAHNAFALLLKTPSLL